MANSEQLEILKQGVEVWNKWCEENESVRIDLSNADLSKVCLDGVNFSSANLIGADLSFATLKGANLYKAQLNRVSLNGTDISGVDIREANITKAYMLATIIAYVNLSETIGLEKTLHGWLSHIDTSTLSLSKGKIPEAFLRGCGLSNWEIESAKLYNPDLTNDEIVKIQYRIYELRATQALQISPLFISYSHQDKPFVDKIDTALIKKGVRFWRDIHNATVGRLETQIDRAIRQHPTVLLILSKNSIKSDWVEHEVRSARKLEKELGFDVLCPIALDDGWKSSPWPKHVMEQVMEYNILDFSRWENDTVFAEMFAKLLNGLDLFYKKLKE